MPFLYKSFFISKFYFNMLFFQLVLQGKKDDIYKRTDKFTQ